MRVYLPSTFEGLAAAHATGEVGPSPLDACAVTPALREWYASGDEEELEYVALSEAARVSLRMLAVAPVPARRVVLAADVGEELVEPRPDRGRAAVRVRGPVPLRRVAAIHVDDPTAEAQVSAAVSALAAAEGGDEDARFTVDGADACELGWYATQELTSLVTSH